MYVYYICYSFTHAHTHTRTRTRAHIMILHAPLLAATFHEVTTLCHAPHLSLRRCSPPLPSPPNSQAIFALRSSLRWALSGTPLQVLVLVFSTNKKSISSRV
ncbi:hypothetical protein T492DRAFT_490689 [Pavlovales sp. CCMP2436]|nr:hypothetical protein T492DRAFT_490689 [Pavlovales sp. CCMP2436]